MAQLTEADLKEFAQAILAARREIQADVQPRGGLYTPKRAALFFIQEGSVRVKRTAASDRWQPHVRPRALSIHD